MKGLFVLSSQLARAPSSRIPIYIEVYMSVNTQHEAARAANTTGNPAPLGLIGFGMTTVLLNLHNIGLYPVDSMIMGMGIFVGGLAQVIAGIQEWKKNNTFGATAFTAYGAFWMALVASWTLPKISFFAVNATTQQATVMPLAAASGELDMAFFLCLWGLFTLGMFFGTLKMNRALQIIFGTLTALFFLLGLRDFLAAGSLPAISTLVGLCAGWVGIVCGLSAVYASIAQVLNEVYGRAVMPLGSSKL